MHVDCVNRFEPLTSQKASSSSSIEPSGSLCSGVTCIFSGLQGESLRREGKGEEVEGSYLEFFGVG